MTGDRCYYLSGPTRKEDQDRCPSKARVFFRFDDHPTVTYGYCHDHALVVEGAYDVSVVHGKRRLVA